MRQSELPRTFSCKFFPLKTLSIRITFSARRGTTGDGRHDADRVAILGSRIFLVEETDILVVQVHVHEAANFSFVGKKMFLQLGKRTRQAAERLAHRGRATLDAGLLPCKLAERRRNQNLYGHTFVSPLLDSGCGSPVALNVSSKERVPPKQ